MARRKTSTKEERGEAYDFVEAWNLLKCGWDILDANIRLGWENSRNQEINNLNRAYVIVKQKFNQILNAYPEIRKRHSHFLFDSIPNLTGVTGEYVENWYIGEPIAPESGDDCPYGAVDYRREQLSAVEEMAILVGAKSLEMPEDAKNREAYDDAVEELENASAAKRLLEEGNIQEYTLTWNKYTGKVMINEVYEIAKPQVDNASMPTIIMRTINQHQEANEKQFNFTFKQKDKKRLVSQIINEDLHITPTLRAIFFDGSRGNKVCFRSPVSREEALRSVANPKKLYELDLVLARNGAKIQ